LVSVDLTVAVVLPVGDVDGRDGLSYTRICADFSLNWKTFNLQGIAFRGVDNSAFNEIDPTVNYAFWGGIVQLDWAGLANNRLVGSLMYNWVRPPSSNSLLRVDAYSALMRYYLGSWSAVNIALHAEYTHRALGSGNPFKEDLFTILLDFDF